MTTLFCEQQRFTQWWFWLLVGGLSLGAWVSAYVQLVAGTPVGNKPASDGMMLALWVGVGVLFPLFFYSCKLMVEVYPGVLRYRFAPFHLRWHEIPAESLAEATAVTYRPLRDYGGWGIRYSSQGKAYNVRGNRGVRVCLTSGQTILFGSQRAEELASALQTMG
ncbi:MAG: hypothetical protein DRH30_08530 [Deltaproteobacteria bacterium]|nr:MAG: hypothetical protein DRH30_08530 [Deltaproteobacteria bacterium]